MLNNTTRASTVFSALWPPSIALWGSLVLPYNLVVNEKHLQVPETSIYVKIRGLPVLSVVSFGMRTRRVRTF
jgi:hypothetical protein